MWKSENAGTTFVPIFDHYGTGSIGDVAVHQRDPRIIWVGTGEADDGATWTRVDAAIPDVPPRLWVSDVEASPHDAATAYISFDGHRSDDFGTWVFATTDYGATWRNPGAGLPPGHPVHVLLADSVNRRLLFAGTESGVFLTLDGGGTWMPFMNGMPTVAVHDLVVHPRDHDLIAGTHGRSLYVLDDITALQQLTPAVLEADVHLFAQRDATWWVDQSRGGQFGDDTYAGRNPPSVQAPGSAMDRAKIVNTPLVTWYLSPAAGSPVSLTIQTLDGALSRTVAVEPKAGITRFVWDGRFERPAGEPSPAPPAGESAFLAAFRPPPGVPAGPVPGDAHGGRRARRDGPAHPRGSHRVLGVAVKGPGPPAPRA